MTDVSLEVLNQRTAAAAVHAEAARIGADADALLDSKAFYGRVTALDPDAPGFRKQIQDLVAAGNAAAPASRAGQPAPEPGPQQWTREQAAAIGKSDPQALVKAINEGHLVSLGYPPAAAGRAQQAAPAQPAAPAGPQQWTMDDVDKSTPTELVAAMEAGHLRDLGYAPRKKR
jgi:hypothetical protein